MACAEDLGFRVLMVIVWLPPRSFRSLFFANRDVWECCGYWSTMGDLQITIGQEEGTFPLFRAEYSTCLDSGFVNTRPAIYRQ